ncbi:LPS translocon maturation chaperone LptM [Alteromonas sp. 14N.309.X.WAT.G.H12]|uniref:LPS translocon maturation chaperone LptM n=1 Tax=Alteromonas sp. 14N.309.X.WAT.G.H12 TaxID=3120824 RepID=UPI002FD1FBC9
MRRKSFFFIILILAATALSACGYRGDLYLPDEAKSNQPSSPEEPADNSGEQQ